MYPNTLPLYNYFQILDLLIQKQGNGVKGTIYFISLLLLLLLLLLFYQDS